MGINIVSGINGGAQNDKIKEISEKMLRPNKDLATQLVEAKENLFNPEQK